jgi:hypothetical protein
MLYKLGLQVDEVDIGLVHQNAFVNQVSWELLLDDVAFRGFNLAAAP